MWSWWKRWRDKGRPPEPAAARPRNDAIQAPPPGAWRLSRAFREAITSFDGRPPGAHPAGSGPAPAPGWRGQSPILGIDLGTTHAVAAVVQGDHVLVIPNQEGDRLTPCVVARTDQDDWLVGEPARRQAVTNPQRTAHAFKRLLGRHAPPRLSLGGADYPPEQLSALVLRKLKDAAEAHLGVEVRRALLTVPAYFDEAQRQATLDAARIAGFDPEWELTDPQTGKMRPRRMRVINEPTAAALAYALTGAWARPHKLVVLHMGGGTFDVSVLDVGEGVFKVEAVHGDTALGGEDFDDAVVAHLAEEFARAHPVDLRHDPAALRRLREAAELAKRDLSQALHAEVCLPYIAGGEHGPVDLRRSLSRARFEALVAGLLERCRGSVRRALADSKLRPRDVDEVMLVGGMTRMPCLQRLVREVFGKDASRRINSDEAVAVGAAIHAAQLALGARSALLLVDVTPLSLGLEGPGGRLVRLVEGNTSIPTDKREAVSLPAPNGRVTVRVWQGEGAGAGGPDQRLLGEVVLDGVKADPAGLAQVEVTFSLDANGILDVTARAPASGQSRTARMFPSGGLGPAEVERLYREAEQQRLFRRRGLGL
jgi:molecular chaperone DnaK